MRVIVDRGACIGCELCAETCSDVFEMYDDLSWVIGEEIAEAHRACVEESVDICPVEAIAIGPQDGPV